IDEKTAVAEKLPTFLKNPRRLLLDIVIVCIKVTKKDCIEFQIASPFELKVLNYVTWLPRNEEGPASNKRNSISRTLRHCEACDKNILFGDYCTQAEAN